MNRKRPVILLLLIVIAPMVLLTWLALRVADSEKAALQGQVKQLLAARLETIDASVVRHFQEVEADLMRITDISDLSTGALRALARREPRVDELVLQDASGMVLHPPPDETRNSSEEILMSRIGQLIEDRDFLELAGIDPRDAEESSSIIDESAGRLPAQSRAAPPLDNAAQTAPRWTVVKVAPVAFENDQQDESAAEPAAENAAPESLPAEPKAMLQGVTNPVPDAPVPADSAIRQQAARPSAAVTAQELLHNAGSKRREDRHGWLPWYFGRGVQLIFWRRLPGDRVVAVMLGRTQWMSELVAKLPDTTSPSEQSISRATDNLTQQRIQLLNSQGKPVYQWGNFEVPDGMEPAAEMALSEPVSSWRLTCYAPLDQWGAGLGASVLLNLGAGLIVASLGICLLAWLFYSEYRRDIREAEQRVSFVNQVSHELRTPLTNIRMYAELLGKDLDCAEEQFPTARGRLEVIDGESQRLSRLIGNVLTFARSQRRRLVLKREPGRVDDIVEHVVNGFGPGLHQAGVEIEKALDAGARVLFDPDVVEQILGNLLSNVEKYAAGHAVRVTSSQTNQTTTIDVSDGGPGLPEELHERVFEPFFRLSDDVQHASGTGIGLSIARELARLHNGDLVVVPCEAGCCFRLTLETPSAD